MVTYKLALDERRAKQDNTYPLVVRVTHNRKVLTLQTGVSLSKKHWNKQTLQVSKTCKNASDLTHKASEFLVRVQKAILTIERDNEFSLDSLKEVLSPKPIIPKAPITFLEFANEIIADFMKVKRTGNGMVYATAVRRLLGYCNNPKITFKDITFTFLEDFKTKLLQDGAKINTIGNYLRSIRAIYNKAIKAKHVARELYPFHDISIKTEKTAKRAITIDELARIFQYNKKVNSLEWHAANHFFLSFALRGMSFTDIAYLTNRNVHKGFISYKRRKTRKLYNIRLNPLALEILKLYKDNVTGYLIPVFPIGTSEDSIEAKKATQHWIKQTNDYLKQLAKKCNIESNVTTYVARHTWATTAKRLGYPNEMIAEALGHEYGNKITNTYLDDYDEDLINEMNKKVIAGIYKCQYEIKPVYNYTLRYINKVVIYIQLKQLLPYPIRLSVVKNKARYN